MINERELKVLDAISDIEDEVMGRYRKDGDLGPFLEMFRYTMNNLEAAVTFQMTGEHFKRLGLDFDKVLRSAVSNSGNDESVSELIREILGSSEEDDEQEKKSKELAGNDSADGEPEKKSQAAAPSELLAGLTAEMPKVVFYVPGYGPSVSVEPLVSRGFDLKSKGTREIRFAETDFLICFHEEDVERSWDRYYLTGPAVIYAVDKDDMVRSLTEDEIRLITSICLHKEETKADLAEACPVFRLC